MRQISLSQLVPRIAGEWCDTWNIPPERDYDEEARSLVAIINRWANDTGLPGRVTLNDFASKEPLALGHFDYARKMALYMIEAVE